MTTIQHPMAALDEHPAPHGEPAATPAATGRAGKRIGWVDAARGLGILLVVIGHALGGLIDSPVGGGQVLFRQVFFAIYTFHMPLFLLLSGLLVPARVERGSGAFLRGLPRAVVWPYFLWSAVQFTLIFALGSLVNKPVTDYWGSIAALPWRTISQFWFLYALFWMHVIAAAVLTLLPRGGVWALLALGLLMKLAAAVLPMDVTVRLVAGNLVWYALGAALGTGGVARLLGPGLSLRAAALPAVATGVIGLTLLHAQTSGGGAALTAGAAPFIANLAGRNWAIPAALAGTAAVLALARIPWLAGARWLAVLGQRTMAIFILHVMFIAGTRIVLLRLHLTTDAAALLLPLVVAGIAGPLLAERLLRPLRLQRWLGF